MHTKQMYNTYRKTLLRLSEVRTQQIIILNKNRNKCNNKKLAEKSVQRGSLKIVDQLQLVP